MATLSNLRLFLACMLFILGILTLHAKDYNDKKLEYQKKAIYYEIRAVLEAGDLTLEEAQRKWQKAIKKLEKKEGK